MRLRRAAWSRRLPLVLPVGLAVVLVAGCGGSSSSGATDPTEWADSLCGSVDTWAKSIRSAAASLQGGNVSKNSLNSAATEVKDATNTLADDLKGLGKPDTQGGQQAKESLDKLSSEYKSEVQTMESDVKDASGASGAVTAVSKVSSTLVTMGGQLQSTFSDLEKVDAKGELDKAFKNAGNCKALTKQGS